MGNWGQIDRVSTTTTRKSGEQSTWQAIDCLIAWWREKQTGTRNEPARSAAEERPATGDRRSAELDGGRCLLAHGGRKVRSLPELRFGSRWIGLEYVNSVLGARLGYRPSAFGLVGSFYGHADSFSFRDGELDRIGTRF